MAERDGALTAIAVVESADGVRSVAQSHDQAFAARLLAEESVGLAVELPAPGEFAPT